jgi:hypothetical protein
VADFDEEALRGVQEPLLGLLPGYRRWSHSLTMSTIVAAAGARAGTPSSIGTPPM